ncbi:hypothetical protein RR48_06665 [Papilio machaon]|uniref:Uncharacterized protein n=1 Tax=Papilio machaon TaxID=76193 RepID=A0A194R5L0_PAPMA|nr:hypothetical protein RR48_06665 [Papilio machaon]
MLEPNYQNRIKVDQIISSEWIAMDSRLLEWTPQETLAFKKAKEERSHLQKKLESTELIKNEKESCLPEKSLVTNSIDVTGSTSSWYKMHSISNLVLRMSIDHLGAPLVYFIKKTNTISYRFKVNLILDSTA